MEIKKENFLDVFSKDYSEVPKIIFEDTNLQLIVGRWLGLFPSKKGFGDTVYEYLAAKETNEKISISKEKYDEIAIKFGILLKLAGIDVLETCVLSQFDEKKLSFNCHFNNRDDDAYVTLWWRDIKGFPALIRIIYQNVSKDYEYLKETEKQPVRLFLKNYTIKNLSNGNTYSRRLPPLEHFEVRNKDFSFSINICRYRKKVLEILDNRNFKLKNEEELQQYLLGLTFPLDIVEVFKRICEISIDSINEFLFFELEVKRKDFIMEKITDKIYFDRGKLDELMITRNDRTIMMDSNGNLLDNFSDNTVSSSNSNRLSLKLVTQLLNVADSSELSSEVKKEIKEQTEILVRAMLKKKIKIDVKY